VPASKQSTKLYDIYLILYVQSWTPDDGRKDRSKHVEWYSVNSNNCASNWFYYVIQSTNLYDIYLILYVQSWTPDDGRKDRPKHVEWYSINSKSCASSWFYYMSYSQRTCMTYTWSCIYSLELLMMDGKTFRNT